MNDRLRDDTVTRMHEYKERIISPQSSHGGGGGGGGQMENLEKRVDKLENSLADLKIELAKLSARAESFSTKSDIAELKGELGLKIRDSQDLILSKLDERFRAIEEKARWKWGTVIIPLSVGIAGVLATILATHLSK